MKSSKYVIILTDGSGTRLRPLSYRIPKLLLEIAYVIIRKYSRIGNFCDLSDIIIFDNTIIDKSCKLNWCIIDENIKMPDNFNAINCFINKNDKKEFEIITY